MNFYKKQKEESRLMNAVKEKGGSDDDKSADEVATEVEVMEDYKENDEPPNKPEESMDIEVDPVVVKQEEEHESMNIEVDCAAVKQEEEHEASNIGVDLAVVKQEEEQVSTLVAVKDSIEPSAGGLSPCEVEDVRESTNDDKYGGDLLVLSDVSTTDVAVMPTQSIEFGSVSLNRIHHNSPESTH